VAAGIGGLGVDRVRHQLYERLEQFPLFFDEPVVGDGDRRL
jgi:hypothetical protein